MKHILLVNVDPMASESLARDLELAGKHVIWVSTKAEALKAAAERPVDLVVIDLPIAGAGGLALLKSLRLLGDLPCIVATDRHDSRFEEQAFNLGGVQVIRRPLDAARLIPWLERSTRYTGVDANEPLVPGQSGGLQLRRPSRLVLASGVRIHLTKTEYELLVYLADRPGVVVTREELFDALLPHAARGQAALQTHMSRLRTKLGEYGKALKTHWAVGYCFESAT